MSITINTNALAAVAKWALPTLDRPHLHMVLFTNGEYVACDGHRLVRVPCAYDGEPFGVDRSYLLATAAAQQALPNHDDDLAIECKDGCIYLTIANGVKFAVPARDPTVYPPYEQVMPKPGTPDQPRPNGYGFNPRYLAEMDAINSAISEGDNNYVKLVAWNSDRLGAVLFEGAGGVRFVIMPARI